MVIEKIVNNNVITTVLENEIEAVVMGRGIGFKKRVGDLVEEDNVEKIFKLDNPQTKVKLNELLESVEPVYFEITERIVIYAEKLLDKKLSELIYVLLTDHLVFAVEREKQNISLQNPMLWEIKNLYKEEFEIGLWALDLIKKEVNANLPEDEAAFIALHIVNASLDADMYNTMNVTILTKDILKIIEDYFKLEFKDDSLDYIRLVTHLKFFSQRILKREQIGVEEEDLYDILAKKYNKQNKCIDKIAKYIVRQFNYELSKQEKIYLLLHIVRVTNNKI